MTQRPPGTRIGRRPVLVAVLAAAAIGGWVIGSLLGGASPPSTGLPSTTIAPSTTATAVSPLSSSPSATLSSSAGPDTSAAPILELEGDGDGRSAEFDVLVGWQIQWQAEGDQLAIAVTGDRDLGTVLEIEGPASGVTSPPVSGTYRLVITADGPWSITVIQGTG
jgi:hypothetical protein